MRTCLVYVGKAETLSNALNPLLNALGTRLVKPSMRILLSDVDRVYVPLLEFGITFP